MGRASSSNGDRSPTPPTPMMETWVLIPPELSLVLQPPSQQARVWTRVPVTQGRRWSPFQGTVRLGVMPSTAASDSETEVGIEITILNLTFRLASSNSYFPPKKKN